MRPITPNFSERKFAIFRAVSELSYRLDVLRPRGIVSFATGEFRNNFRAVSPRITPNLEKPMRRLLQNGQRLAGMVSTLVSKVSGSLETVVRSPGTHPTFMVRTAEVRSQVHTEMAIPLRRARTKLQLKPEKRSGPDYWQLACSTSPTLEKSHIAR